MEPKIKCLYYHHIARLTSLKFILLAEQLQILNFIMGSGESNQHVKIQKKI